MAPPCAISRDDAIDVLIQNIDHFKTTDFPIFSSPIWDALAQECGGVWSHLSWWVNVTENRRKILSSALEYRGIVLAEFPKKTRTENASYPDSDISFHLSDSEENEGESWFDCIIPQELWNTIKPLESDSTGGSRTNHTLAPGSWTNVIADTFREQHQLPCAYSFRRGEINVSSRRRYYLKIEGRCRAKSCNNQFHGYLNEEPSSIQEEIIIRVRTRNTSRAVHEDVRRYLNGNKRKEFGQQSHNEGTSNMIKRLRRENMGRGDEEGPTIPKAHVIRHAKYEHDNRELGIKKTEGDFIQKIYQLQFERPFMGSINALGYNPFYAFYGLPLQMTLYQDYINAMKDWSNICIDGTGSLVRKVVRELGLKSKHIFLHCIVIHFDKKLVSVFQMLSESQESETFTYWLKRWLSLVRVKPRQSTTDYSRALLTGSSKAFNNMTVKNYLNVYFSFLRDGDPAKLDKISTYLRVDVAHLIHIVCRWDCTKAIQRHRIRDFFIRCIALMVDCQYLSDFDEIWTLTCAVGANAHEDSVLNLKSVMTVKNARQTLEIYMKKRNVNIEEYLETSEIDEEDEIEFQEDEDGPSTIESHIQKLTTQATSIIHEGSELNSFYVPKFIEEMKKLGNEFVLWTAVGVPFFSRHASSSYAEKNFQDLKHNVLGRYSRQIGLEKFLRVHMRDLLGGTKGVSDKLIKFTVRGKSLPEPVLKAHGSKKAQKGRGGRNNFDDSIDVNLGNFSDDQCSELSGSIINDSDLLSRENWRGKGETGVFDAFPENDGSHDAPEVPIGRGESRRGRKVRVEADDGSNTHEEDESNKDVSRHSMGWMCEICDEFIDPENFDQHICC